MLGIKENTLPTVAIIDPYNGKWTLFGKKLNYKEFKKWFRLTKKKWNGPGNGPFSSIFNTYYSIKAEGGIAMYIIVFCLLVLLVIILYITFDFLNFFWFTPKKLD